MTHADILITNARVLTMDPGSPVASWVAISGNRIAAVGTSEGLAGIAAHWCGPKTRVINAKHNTVMPGIIEGHVHLFIGGVELSLLNINQLKGFDVIRDAVRDYARGNPDLKIIHVLGATHDHFGEGVKITRHLLDRIIEDRPLMIGCFDHHTAWANTAALEAADLMRGRDLPVGNEVVLDKDGLATGELLEPAAFDPLLQMSATGGREAAGFTTGRSPVPEPTAEQRKVDVKFMQRGIAHANSLGITTMHNMDGNWYQLELLHDLEKRGELNARVEVPFHYKNFFKLEDMDEAVAFRERYQSDMLHSGRVKLFIDGVMETFTALMLDDYPGAPGNKGEPLYGAEEFNAIVARADELGLQVSVHAIGDGGVRRTLDAYEFAQKQNGLRDSRHRIEHIELIDPADIPRLAELGVTASIQPIAGVGVPGSPQEPILSRVGDKLPYAYPWQMLRDTGIHMAFSSDWPIAPLDPFIGMQSAMTCKPLRQDCADQSQSLHNTLHAFTAAGAHMEFMEHQKGMIKVGYLADIIVLDQDIEGVKKTEIANVKPTHTICDGRVVFER